MPSVYYEDLRRHLHRDDNRHRARLRPTQQETVTPAAAAKLAFSSPALNLVAGGRGVVTLQLTDLYGNSAYPPVPQIISLGNKQRAGAFYSSATSTAPIVSIGIGIGLSNVSVYYGDTRAGKLHLYAF